MARKKLDPDRLYRVQLKKPLQIGRMWLRPGQPHQLKGRLVEEHKDAIEGVEEA